MDTLNTQMQQYNTTDGYTIQATLHMTATERKRIRQIIDEVAKTQDITLDIKREYNPGRERWLYSRVDEDITITRFYKEKASDGKMITRSNKFIIIN